MSRSVGGIDAPIGKFEAEDKGSAGVEGVIGEAGDDSMGLVGGAARRQGKKFRVRREVCPRELMDSVEVVREVDGRWLRYIADIGYGRSNTQIRSEKEMRKGFDHEPPDLSTH